MNDRDEDTGFLSRWSRKKIAAKAEPEAGASLPAVAVPDEAAEAPADAIVVDLAAPPVPVSDGSALLPDIETLANDGDFSPFMAKGVDAATRNQAMKKLFTDPHYSFDNMDKLDIYLDDYSKPDPIPLEMLRGLNQAKRLFLFEDEEKQEAGAGQLTQAHAAAAVALSPASPDRVAPDESGETESNARPKTVISESAQPK